MIQEREKTPIGRKILNLFPFIFGESKMFSMVQPNDKHRCSICNSNYLMMTGESKDEPTAALCDDCGSIWSISYPPNKKHIEFLENVKESIEYL